MFYERRYMYGEKGILNYGKLLGCSLGREDFRYRGGGGIL